MNCLELKSIIENKLSKEVSSKIFLDNLLFLNDDFRSSNIYLDPKYFPFYAWLGSTINPKNILEFGLGLGIIGSCFLKTCKTVDNYLTFQENIKDYNYKIAISNIRFNYKKNLDFYIGNIYDEEFDIKIKKQLWDLAIINCSCGYDKYRNYLDLSWENLNDKGFLIIDNFYNKYCQNACKDFAKINRKEICIVDTRYGVCLLQR